MAPADDERTLKIATAGMVAALGELFSVFDTVPSHLPVVALRGLTALIRRAIEAAQSADACAALLHSTDPARAAELSSLCERVRQADRELIDLRASADRLRELEASQVRLQIADTRRLARQVLTGSASVQASANQELAAARGLIGGTSYSVPSDPEISKLRARLDLYRDERENLAIEAGQLRRELDEMRGRVEAAEALAAASISTSKKDSQLLNEYRKVGKLAAVRQANQDLARYTALGTAAEIRRRLAADAATVQFLTAILSHTRDALATYEALIGPLVLSAFRQCGALDTAIGVLQRHRLESSSAPMFDYGTILGPALSAISRLAPDAYTLNGQSAVDLLARSIANADPSSSTTVEGERRRLVERCTLLVQEIAAIRPDPDIARFLADIDGQLLSVTQPTDLAEEVANSHGTGSPSRRDGDRAFPAGTGVPPVVDGSAVAGGGSSASPRNRMVGSKSSSSKRARSTGSVADPDDSTREIKKKKPTADSTAGAPEVKKKKPTADPTTPIVDLTSSPSTKLPMRPNRGSNYYSQQVHETCRATWGDWCPGWPEHPPTLLPTDLLQLQRLAWKFRWFPEERVPPNHNQYAAAIATAGGRAASAEEVTEWLATCPWEDLMPLIPEPTLFNPLDEMFADLYLDTRKFYIKALPALWTRTHFLVTSNDASHQQWRSDRKNQRSSATPWVTDHFQRLLDFLRANPEVDLDLLLDPFFLWPPGGASAFLIPRPGETLAQAVDRVDAAEPERAFFLRQPDAHPSRGVLDRIRHKFWHGPAPPMRPRRAFPPRDGDNELPIRAADVLTVGSEVPLRRRIRSQIDRSEGDEEFAPAPVGGAIDPATSSSGSLSSSADTTPPADVAFVRVRDESSVATPVVADESVASPVPPTPVSDTAPTGGGDAGLSPDADAAEPDVPSAPAAPGPRGSTTLSNRQPSSI